MARSFIFRLETVLRVRRIHRDARQRAVAECLGRLHALEGQVERCCGELRRAFEASRDVRAGGSIDLSAIRERQLYAGRLQRRIFELSSQRAALHKELELRRGELIQADTEVKALEKLRGRRAAEHRATLIRQEQFTMDEAGTQQFLRRHTAGESA